MSAGQVITDVAPEEPDAACSTPCLFLCFAEVEMEVVVMTPRCQGSDLLSVGLLIVAGDQAYDGRVISKLNDGVGAVGGHTVMREQGVQERTEHTALGGTGV